MDSIKRYLANLKLFGFFLGIVLFIAIYVLNPVENSIAGNNTAAIAVLMATWWIFEAIPLGATALIPIAFFPFLGILEGKEVSSSYFNSSIMLFLGGFFIAIAMEKWELHKRISLMIIKTIGGTPSRMILGFMIATAFLSMFISNTATAIMMLPIGIAVISAMERSYSKEKTNTFAIALMLAIAYSASIGGIATLVGTPPNLAFHRIFQISFPNAPEITFGDWMLLGVPLSITMLTILWLILTKVFYRCSKDMIIGKDIIHQEIKKIGTMPYEEKAVLSVFALTGFLWIFRKGLDIGFVEIPGWSSIFSFGDYIDDGTVAIFMAVVLFIIPAKTKKEKVRLLSVKDFKRIPWEIVILFGGGFALAKGFQSSGLSEFIGNHFTDLAGVPDIVIIFTVCTVLTFLTELTSNTATTQTILPILAGISISVGINPLFLMIPATISASCAFMLPVATPPNAIVFGSGRIKVKDMVRTGFVLNIIGIIVVTLVCYFIGNPLFGVESGVIPDWAR